MKRSLKEALWVVLCAAALGTGYTAVTGKGLFAPAAPVPADDPAPQFISFDEAVALADTADPLFVDTRTPYDFALGHIRGAVNVPLKDFPASLSAITTVPKDRLLVTYCDGEECNSSIDLAVKLDSAGYTNVRILFGGWREWSAKGEPVGP